MIGMFWQQASYDFRKPKARVVRPRCNGGIENRETQTVPLKSPSLFCPPQAPKPRFSRCLQGEKGEGEGHGVHEVGQRRRQVRTFPGQGLSQDRTRHAVP